MELEVVKTTTPSDPIDDNVGVMTTPGLHLLVLRPRQMAAVLQMLFWNAYSLIKIYLTQIPLNVEHMWPINNNTSIIQMMA